MHEAQGIASVQSKESIKIAGKNIYPYQYDNGDFKEIRIRQGSKDDTESLQLDMQGDEKESSMPEDVTANNLCHTPMSPLRSPRRFLDNEDNIEQNQPIPLTISSLKLIPIGDNGNDQSFDDIGDLEVMNTPVRTGNSEFDIQLSPNRTKIVGGGGIIMRTNSPRMQSRRRRSVSGGVKFLDTVERGPVQSEIRLDVMVRNMATALGKMKLKKGKKKSGHRKKHRRNRSGDTPSPQRRRMHSGEHRSKRDSKRRDQTLVTFEDTKTVLENVETLQDHQRELLATVPQHEHPQDGMRMQREFKKRKSLSVLGKSQAIDVSVDDDFA